MGSARSLGSTALEIDDDQIRALKHGSEVIVKVTATSVIIEKKPATGKSIFYRVPKTFVSEDDVIHA